MRRWGYGMVLGLLLAVPGLAGALTLGWDLPTTFADLSPATPADVTAIRVYRNTDGGAFALYLTVDGPAVSTTDPVPGVGTLGYVATALGTTGLESAQSQAVYVRWPPQDVTIPYAAGAEVTTGGASTGSVTSSTGTGGGVTRPQ